MDTTNSLALVDAPAAIHGEVPARTPSPKGQPSNALLDESPMSSVVPEHEAMERELRLLRKSEQHFRSILENISDVIAIVLPDGLFAYESPSIERALGYRPSALIGTAFIDFVHPDDAASALEFLATQNADADAIQTVELRLRHADDHWRPFEVVATNRLEGSVVSSIVMNARDITERKLLQRQLAQANRVTSLGRLAATVAHEFNNVLMGMQPFAELMQRPEATAAMLIRGASHISASIQRGKRIAMDILRFTQSAEPVTAVVEMSTWWDSFAAEAEVVLGNNIRLVSDLTQANLCVVADKAQLSQVMSNLVANARDAMPQGGTLTVRICAPEPRATFSFGVVPSPEEFVQISVSDTGSGMLPDVMHHVFEPLFTTKHSGGTGLGLAVAHQVILHHRGHIFVESTVGRGTTFHIFVPRGPERCDPLEHATETRTPRPQRVLMIEDETCIVEGVSALLSASGLDVMAIGSGSESEAAVTTFAPDVVLLDYGLPDMDGAEVYRRIRKLEKRLPIIFATGHADITFLQDGGSDSRTRLLRKPFETTALLELIEELQAPEPPESPT